MHGTIQVSIVTELGRPDLRRRDAGKKALIARKSCGHLIAKRIDELGVARNAARDHKHLGVEHRLKVYEHGIERARIAVKRALRRRIAGLDPLKNAAAVHRAIGR